MKDLRGNIQAESWSILGVSSCFFTGELRADYVSGTLGAKGNWHKMRLERETRPSSFKSLVDHIQLSSEQSRSYLRAFWKKGVDGGSGETTQEDVNILQVRDSDTFN